MKIVDIEILINRYGENATLKEVLRAEQGDYIHVCLKCAGRGIVREKYFIGEGYNQEEKTREIKCNLCNGIGYTKEKYVKKYKKVFDDYVKEREEK